MNSSTHPRLALTALRLPLGTAALDCDLGIPDSACGLVIFAHGSGSSRHSPRNRFVAEALHEQHIATLLLDLLTLEEEHLDQQTAHIRFNIELLAERLVRATDWVLNEPRTHNLRLGYFGASTGAGAAMLAAAQRPRQIAAVVSRGGRPDLALEVLGQVQAPTLLLVGGRDYPVIELNREALDRLTAAEERRLVIVPGATHLFQEPGTLEEVARLAGDWFGRWFTKSE